VQRLFWVWDIIWSSVPMAYSLIWPKSRNSSVRDGTLSIRNFMLMFKKPMDPNFEPLRSIGFNGHYPSIVPKFNHRHDGALSIRNIALNQAQLIISHILVNWPTAKKCAPYFRGTWNFLFFGLFTVLFLSIFVEKIEKIFFGEFLKPSIDFRLKYDKIVSF
jgi:hypothetical protein